MLCFVLKHYESWFWQRLNTMVCLLEKLQFAGQTQLSKQSSFVFDLFVNMPRLHAKRMRSHEHFRDDSDIRGKDNTIIFASQGCKRTEAVGDNMLFLLSQDWGLTAAVVPNQTRDWWSKSFGWLCELIFGLPGAKPGSTRRKPLALGERKNFHVLWTLLSNASGLLAYLTLQNVWQGYCYK